ncbi:MAG: adenylate/guanylate cyclase domain-containing protein, partial [Candidatus Riflebacteria bacterium]|nr:adenylate/guanylate cyclase domain-containing protein [Candidatus Riflebacteria bacterium]
IRDFTTPCEKNAPDVITRLLNHHFNHMSQIIYAHGGQISRFVGDAIEACFPCNDEQRADSLSKAAAAGLTMLQTMALINEERARQGFFTYRIGIGIAAGSSRTVHIGSRGSRNEVLQVGGTLKKAGELEALSKEYPGLPLVIAADAGEALIRHSEFARILQRQVLGEETVFVCTKTLEETRLINFSAAEHGQPAWQHEKAEKTDGKSNNTFSYDQFAEQIKSARVNLFPGLFILIVPFLLSLFGLYNGLDRYHSDLNRRAHAANQRFLEREKSGQSKKAMIELHIRKVADRLLQNIGFDQNSSRPDQLTEVKTCLDKELRAAGLHPEEIMIIPWPEPQKQGKNLQTDDTSQRPLNRQLTETLHSCLAAYGLQFNRFLVPDDEKLRFLGETMSGLLLARDSRGRFENVSIASESFWLYWQPILNRRYLEHLEHCRKLDNYSAFPQEMRYFGRFGATEYRSLLAGGILLLCRPPETAGSLQLRPVDDSIVSARIDLKHLSIEDEQGNIAKLLADNGIEQGTGNRAAQLLSLAYKSENTVAGWAVDKTISRGELPKVHLVATRLVQPKSWIANEKAGVTIILALMVLTAAGWFKATREQGLATSVRGQIFGSFLGTMLLPVAGLLFVLVMLIGDWQENLLKDSVAIFRHQVGMIEQQTGFHQFAAPKKLQKILENAGLTNLLSLKLPEDDESDKFKAARQRLLKMLDTFWQKIFNQTQGLGVSSLMVDATNGLSEFIAIDGSVSPEGDPMKKALSFHAGRVMSRLDPSLSRKSIDNTRLLVDEMTTQLIFEVLESTFGSDAALEILFAQNNGVDLFSSVSNDVFFQS